MNQRHATQIVADYAQKFPALLTVKVAAELADVPVGTIYDWSSRGFFDDYKFRRGRHLRITRDRFVRFLLEDDHDGDGMMSNSEDHCRRIKRGLAERAVRQGRTAGQESLVA